MAGFNNATGFYPQIIGELTVYPGPIHEVTATVDDNVGTPYVEVTQTPTVQGLDILFAFFNMKGEQGETGNGIQSIVKTSTVGLVDTYTITYTDGTTSTFNVTNGAKGDTGNGIQSIAKSGTSGLVDTYTITFTNGQTTTFTVTNGAKGDTGATGNGIASIAKTSTVGLVDTYTITFTDGTTTTFDVTNGEDGTVTTDQLMEAIANQLPTDNASGSIASFPDGADDVPVKSLIAQITPVQNGAGNPAPDNIRPISGWTGAKITDVNDLAKQPYFGGLLNGSYGFANLSQLSWTVVAAGTAHERFQTQSLKTIAKPPADNYTVAAMISNGLGSATAAHVANDDDVVNEIGMYVNGVIEVRYPSVHNTTDFIAAMSNVYLIYELATATTPTITDADYSMLLEKFSAGYAVDIDWTDEAGTVYGGTLNVTTGLLTDEFSQKATFTGTENWLLDTRYNSRYSAFYVTRNTLARVDDYRGSIIASNMMTIERAGLAFDSQVNTIAITGYSNSPSSLTNYLYIIVDNQAAGYEGITTAAALKTWLGNNNVEVTFKAQTPQTYQLAPTEVKTLLGDNSIWADCGNVDVTYRADIAKYIAKQLAAVQALILENQ